MCDRCCCFRCCFCYCFVVLVVPVAVITHCIVHLMYGACFRINEVLFNKISCGIFHHKFHTSLPKSFRHSVPNPKPNESFLRYSTTVNCSTFRTTVVLFSTFGTKTCTTLQNTKEGNVCLNVCILKLKVIMIK